MFWLLITQIGVAGGFSDALESARENFADGKYADMEKDLVQAKKSLGGINKIVKPEQLAFMVYLSSLSIAKRGGDPLDLWRKTFSLYGQYEGEITLFASREQADLFRAIRVEMDYTDRQTAYIPKRVGNAKLYVDGQKREFEDTILPGEHFLQIQCPKGEIVSKWHTLEEDPKWLSMCPYEIDVSVSNNDDPFSLDALDEGIADIDTEPETENTDRVDEESAQEELVDVQSADPTEETDTEPESYFSGVKIMKMKAKPVFWVGLDGGFFVDSKETLRFHGDVMVLYHLEKLELEVHTGVQFSGGINYIITDGAMLGVHGGYHILNDDLFVDARFRKEVSFTEGIHGYSRVRFGYQYSWKRVFGGVDVGLVFAIF